MAYLKSTQTFKKQVCCKYVCIKSPFLCLMCTHTYITEDLYQYIPSDSKPGKGEGRRKK